VRLTVEQGADNKVNVHFLTLTQRWDLLTKGAVPGLRADTLNVYYPENNPHTYAHEVGHMMGFPDQYWYGIVATGAMGTNGLPVPGAAFPIDDDSIMGQSMSQATTVHINAKWIFDWINANVDDMKPLAV
jgi:hypothetical protein